MVKAHFNKEMFLANGLVNAGDAPDIIKRVIKEKVDQHVKAIIEGGFDRIERVLNGNVV